jgi:hypothetical protein
MNIYRGIITHLDPHLPRLSLRGADLNCDRCGIAVQQLLTVPGAAIGRGERTFSVVRCINCVFFEPYYVFFATDRPIRIVHGAGEAQGRLGEGWRERVDLSLRFIPGAPAPDDGYLQFTTYAGGSPSWVQYEDWPNCVRCQQPMEFILQLSSETLLDGTEQVDARFFMDIDHFGTLYLFHCERCNVSCSVTQCT